MERNRAINFINEAKEPQTQIDLFDNMRSGVRIPEFTASMCWVRVLPG